MARRSEHERIVRKAGRPPLASAAIFIIECFYRALPCVGSECGQGVIRAHDLNLLEQLMLYSPLQPGCTQASVRKTFFVSERRPSGVLSLVQCADDTVAIHLDGRPCGGRRWPLAELEAAVDAYLHLNAELKRGGKEPQVDCDKALPARITSAAHPDAA
jgi:hypothetical protein